MKIMLLSLAARGHAVADAFARSSDRPGIVSVVPARNPGIAKIASSMHIADLMDFPRILEIAKKEAPDFVFIAPDDPIGAGLADALRDIGIPSVAPLKSLARIESSKGFTRILLERYGIDASPKFTVFRSNDRKAIQRYIEDDLGGEYVVKYDALKGGKGVKVSSEHLSDIAEGVGYAIECIEECGQVVIEEKLIGVEFSLLGFASGETVIDMPAVQDHKRAYEGDTGPNTGGMGTYSGLNHSLPFLDVADLAKAKALNREVASALLKECSEPYTGILYGGFMAVKDGIRVIEYNARFGDPEALNILPLLTTDFTEICRAIIAGELTEEMVAFEHKATVCKYVTPDCYPESKDRKGAVITLPEATADTRIFYGDVSEDDDGVLRLGGSRTAGIVGIGTTIAEAERAAQALCEKVTGPVRFRRDIGTAALIEERKATMRSLRAS